VPISGRVHPFWPTEQPHGRRGIIKGRRLWPLPFVLLIIHINACECGQVAARFGQVRRGAEMCQVWPGRIPGPVWPAPWRTYREWLIWSCGWSLFGPLDINAESARNASRVRINGQ